jgi:hypothetical protein
MSVSSLVVEGRFEAGLKKSYWIGSGQRRG